MKRRKEETMKKKFSKLWHRLFGHGSHSHTVKRLGNVQAWHYGVVCSCGANWEVRTDLSIVQEK